MSKQLGVDMVDRHTFVAGGTSRVRLDTWGYYTHISVMLAFNISDTGGAVQADGWGRLIKSARIYASGHNRYFDVTDGRQWLYYNHFPYGGRIRQDAIGVATATANYYAEFPFHLGLKPHDFFDTTGVIPGAELTDLFFEITWGTSADLAAGLTINTGTLAEARIKLYGIAVDSLAERDAIWPQGLPNPRFEARIVPIAALYSNLGLESDLPVGDTLIKTVIINLDNLDARTNSRVTDLGVKFPVRREFPWQSNWINFVNEAQIRHQLATQVDGVGMIEWSAVSGRPIGLDLTAAQPGNVKLGFSSATAANGSIHLLHYMMS